MATSFFHNTLALRWRAIIRYLIMEYLPVQQIRDNDKGYSEVAGGEGAEYPSYSPDYTM
jgi:hypothetical protein